MYDLHMYDLCIDWTGVVYRNAFTESKVFCRNVNSKSSGQTYWVGINSGLGLKDPHRDPTFHGILHTSQQFFTRHLLATVAISHGQSVHFLSTAIVHIANKCL